MENKKIIFIGPVGAGKTSAIQAISEIECISTEARISEDTANHKSMTTVAIDYGRLTTDSNVKTHLYGAPGQARFDFMWDMLSDQIARDATGVVVMLDNARECPQDDLKYYLDAFSQLISGKRLVIGVTRSDIQSNPCKGDYEDWLSELKMEGTVHFVDARNRSTIIQLVESIVGPIKGTPVQDDANADSRVTGSMAIA